MVIIAELWEMLINPYELLEMRAFFDGWDQCKFLQILLQDLLSLIYQPIAVGYRGLLLASPQHLLCELNRGLRELDVGVLIYEFFMQKTESLILLAYNPFFLIEGNVDDILGVLTIVNRIVVNSG